MTTYEYVCAECGRFDIRTPIGAARPQLPCPTCQADARRVFSPPMLGLLEKTRAALAQREEQSGDEPAVVSQIPPKAGRTRAPDIHPALAQLPRP